MPHILRSELGASVGGTNRDDAPALPHHVLNVIVAITEEQMCRVDAGGVITPMQDPKPVGDRAESEFPYDAMRPVRSSIELNLAITIRKARPRPRPTRIRAG